jgi:hypothetical protein
MKLQQKKQQEQKLKRQRKVADKDLGVIAQEISSIDLGSLTGSSYTWNTGAGAGSTITMDPSLWNGSITVPSGGFTVGTATTVPYTYTTSGTSGYSFNNPPTTVHINTDGLTMAEGTDITVGGKSLTKAIEKIEERLGILHPNLALEDRWEQLKELRKQYIEMEKDLLEKEKIMKILKES